MDKINIIGVYDDPDLFTDGVRKIRAGGFKVKNAFSPFPVHTIWEEMKMNTRLPLGAFIFSAIGTIGTFAFLYWTSVINYPLKFGGKPSCIAFIHHHYVCIDDPDRCDDDTRHVLYPSEDRTGQKISHDRCQDR